MSYATSTISGDYVVLDQVSGLMWQGCSMGKNSGDCSGSATTAMWYDSTTNTYPAIQYCEDLTLAGYSDWRLPNFHELLSIYLFEAGIVSYPGKAAGSPYINQDVFPSTNSSRYWSSTTEPPVTTNAFTVDFGVAPTITAKTGSYYVRCVRGQ
jgi:hypothetical protein